MAQPIYKVFFLNFKEPWYQLSKTEQDSLLQKVSASFEKVGGKHQVMCDSRWSTESWHGFGLEVYPSIEAVQQHDRDLAALNWFRYVESLTALGTEMS